MKNSTPVSKFMSRQPVVLAPTDTMDTAEKLFRKHGIHHLPVVENGRLKGMVSFSDYLKIIRELFGGAHEARKNDQIKHAITAHEIMTKNLHSLSPTDTLGDAIRLFKANRFHSIPVVQGEQRLTGIVTTFDMLEALEKILVEREEEETRQAAPAE